MFPVCGGVGGGGLRGELIIMWHSSLCLLRLCTDLFIDLSELGSSRIRDYHSSDSLCLIIIDLWVGEDGKINLLNVASSELNVAISILCQGY